MKRISHDLPGVKQRITQLAEDFEVALQDTQEVWRDEKGRSFFQQHTSEVGATIRQLDSTLTQMIELFEEIAKRSADPERL